MTLFTFLQQHQHRRHDTRLHHHHHQQGGQMISAIGGRLSDHLAKQNWPLGRHDS